jgi:hypothetical protein
MGWGYGYPEYVTVAEKKAKAERNLIKLKKKPKYKDIEPIVIEGSTIANTWWGKAQGFCMRLFLNFHNHILTLYIV